MSLAFLTYHGAFNGKHHFNFDIGSNRYYRFLIGKEEQTVNSYGIKMMANPSFASPLNKADKSMLGRGRFEIPVNLFTDEIKLVQLVSYRTPDLVGIAVSELLRVVPEIQDYGELPEISFSKKTEHMQRNYVPFEYKEKPLSESLSGWTALLNVLPALLPSLLPAAVNLVGSVIGAANKPGNSARDVASEVLTDPKVQSSLSSPEMQEALKSVLTTLIENQKNTATVQANTLSSVTARSFAIDGGVLTGPAIAGLVASILPAVMPILDKALSPETIHALADPAKTQELLKIVLEGMRESERSNHEARLKRLESLKTPHPYVTQILDRLARSQSVTTPDYKSVHSVQLSFTDTKPLTLLGRTIVLYKKGKEWVFPVKITTPKAIGRAIMQLLIKETPEGAPLLEKKFKLENLESGQILHDLKVTMAENEGLPVNSDLYIQINLLWKTRNGQMLGTRKTHLIQSVESFTLDRFDGVEQPEIPLNDTVRYRPYWHKVWEGSTSDDIRRYIFDTRYYCILEEDNAENSLMETKIKYDSGEPVRRRMEGKLKSGFIFSPVKLNHLISQISAHPALGPEKLKALMGKNLNERANQAARVQVELKGKEGDSVTLWTYPVLSIHRVLLKRTEGTDEFGQVNALSDEMVYFPLPSSVHFIGVKSERV